MLDTKVKDWTSDRHGVTIEMNYRSLRLSFTVFAIAAAVVWLLLFGLYKSLPYVQNGAAVVGQNKWWTAQSSKMFAPSDRIRVFAFGNSKMLAGFHPAVFEAAPKPLKSMTSKGPGTIQNRRKRPRLPRS